MVKLGDPPAFPTIEKCNKCGNRYNAIWHYGENDGKSVGYAERTCCK